jgi:hypothetical protein
VASEKLLIQRKQMEKSRYINQADTKTFQKVLKQLATPFHSGYILRKRVDFNELDNKIRVVIAKLFIKNNYKLSKKQIKEGIKKVLNHDLTPLQYSKILPELSKDDANSIWHAKTGSETLQ